jgi:hypothetical protein
MIGRDDVQFVVAGLKLLTAQAFSPSLSSHTSFFVVLHISRCLLESGCTFAMQSCDFSSLIADNVWGFPLVPLRYFGYGRNADTSLSFEFLHVLAANIQGKRQGTGLPVEFHFTTSLLTSSLQSSL